MEAHRQARPFQGVALAHNACGQNSFRSERYSDGDLLTDKELKREPVKEPPRKWRNWWLAKRPYAQDVRTGAIFHVGVGNKWCGGTAWPSRDIAESMARRVCDEHPNPDEYLGAFPEGEHP